MSPKPITDNTLFYGDNLKILREYIPDESVDLIYLDPPFNSSRSYNVLFKDESGREAESQIMAFDDTWHWGESAAQQYEALISSAPPHVAAMIGALRQFIGANQMMAYLVMMAGRLVELHRVLKPTGSLYLHCDPTASHYLKIILDTIFGPESFCNELIWQRTSAHANVIQKFGAVHDILLFYTKSKHYTWNQQYVPYDEEYVDTFFDQIDENGKRYARRDLTASMQRASSGQVYTWKGITPPPSRCWAMSKDKMDELETQGRIHWPKREGGMPRLKLYREDMPGNPLQDIWADIKPIHNLAAERLGYPTQKPLALLERIIQASSSPGDWVLDPFCGCGTAVAAAQKLGRRWIGIDITHLSISLQKYRLESMFPSLTVRVVGEPEDLGAARQLAQDDRYQFQWWALSLVRAKPVGGAAGARQGKKGSDKGVDGVITFMDDRSGKAKRVLVQVKSGHVKAGDVRDLIGALQNEDAALGVFISLEAPTREMEAAAHAAGFYDSPGWGKKYPRLQLLTIEDLLKGKTANMPPTAQTLKQAPRADKASEVKQPGLAGLTDV